MSANKGKIEMYAVCTEFNDWLEKRCTMGFKTNDSLKALHSVLFWLCCKFCKDSSLSKIQIKIQSVKVLNKNLEINIWKI